MTIENNGLVIPHDVFMGIHDNMRHRTAFIYSFGGFTMNHNRLFSDVCITANRDDNATFLFTEIQFIGIVHRIMHGEAYFVIDINNCESDSFDVRYIYNNDTEYVTFHSSENDRVVTMNINTLYEFTGEIIRNMEINKIHDMRNMELVESKQFSMSYME